MSPSARRAALILATAIPVALACSGTEIVSSGPTEPNLSVVGYVTIDLDPAYGVVGLYDAGGRPVASSIITNGRYAVSQPVDKGMALCGGWNVRAFVRDDFGPRQDTIPLTEESGACTMPGDRSVEHWIEFDLAPRTWEDR